MSKGISIKEGRVARQFSEVAKVRINDPGGGSNLWVPEEEVQLVVKSVTKNGIYNAIDDDAYGYSVVQVDLDLPTKTISKNGTYKASSDNKDGWAEVVVSVQEKSASGTDTSGNDYTFANDDYGGVTLSTDEGDYDVGVGVDPETGEATVVLTKVPKKIQFTMGSPDYDDGDELDLSRYIVSAFWDEEGNSRSNVTAQCTFNMADGTTLHHDEGPYVLTATYVVGGRTFTADLPLDVDDSVPPGYKATTYTLHFNPKNSWAGGSFSYEHGKMLVPEAYTTFFYVAYYGNNRFIRAGAKNKTSVQGGPATWYFWRTDTSTPGEYPNSASMNIGTIEGANYAAPAQSNIWCVDFQYAGFDVVETTTASTEQEAMQMYNAYIAAL